MPKFKDGGNNIEAGIPKARPKAQAKEPRKTLSLVLPQTELAFRPARSTAHSQLAFSQHQSLHPHR